MAATNSHRPSEDVTRLGPEVFNRHVRQKLQPEDDGKFVAIDIATGDFEIDEDDYNAVMRLRNRHPTADVWLERVGQPAACRMKSGHHPHSAF